MSILQPAITALKSHGLPVLFLEFVDRSSLTVERGSEDQLVQSLFSTKLTLTQKTLDGFKSFSPKPPFGEAVAIQTLYHECTHAYVYLRNTAAVYKWRSQDREVAQIVAFGKKYYHNAKLKGGQMSSDPERLFHEAIASYVGHRAASWWNALAGMTTMQLQMTRIENKPLFEIDRVRQFCRNVALKYNRAMGKRVFGYETKGTFSSSQVSTTKRVPGRLKEFADRVILEGKIPDSFNRTPWKKKHAQWMKILSAPPRTARGG